MPFQKGNTFGRGNAKNKGAIQTRKRPPLETYVISISAKFHADDDTGREIKAWIEANFDSGKDFLVQKYQESNQ
jgi:hypothetical protein